MKSLDERNSLINDHLSLAERCAKRKYRHVNCTVQYGDLLSAAYLGLVDAAEKYDATKANRQAVHSFDCYARHRVNGQMNDFLRSCNWGTRNNPQYVYSLEAAMTYVTSESEAGYTLKDSILSVARSVVDELNSTELFEKLIRALPKRDKLVFRLRFANGLKMHEVASVLDISESRVSQIITENLNYLKSIWSSQSTELWDELTLSA